jgi:tyrosyl-tRNA synthetase
MVLLLLSPSIKNRLERQESLTFTEFNYPILQAYDFYKLYQDYDCVLQIGGSDQWGNIVMGIELCRKLLGKELYGLTTPLLSTSSGKKMGKSEGGAIWLNADMLSPYEFFQYWRNAEDADIERFATLYTEWDSSELDGFKELAVSDVNAAKKKLALRITSICHGEDEATKAFEISRKVFEDRGLDHNMPSFEVAYDAIALKNMHIYDLLTASNLATSKSEARRLIRGNGVRIEDITVKDENQILEPEMFKNQSLKLSVGKKKHILIKYLKKAEI